MRLNSLVGRGCRRQGDDGHGSRLPTTTPRRRWRLRASTLCTKTMRSLANILSSGLLTRFTTGGGGEALVGELWRLEWISMALTESPSSAPRGAGLDKDCLLYTSPSPR